MSSLAIGVILVCIGGYRLIKICRDAIQSRKDNELLSEVTKLNRGTASERRLILSLIKTGISKKAIFHDLYVRKPLDRYSQIDVVVPTPVGIIVFEVKDYKGWIFGKGYQKDWTQVLAYGKTKNKFYNPFFQNNGHIEALKAILKDCGEIPFYSVVVFYGKCLLRDVTYIPENSYIGYSSDLENIVRAILDNNPPAIYKDKWSVISRLKEAVALGDDEEVISGHIRSIAYLAR